MESIVIPRRAALIRVAGGVATAMTVSAAAMALGSTPAGAQRAPVTDVWLEHGGDLSRGARAIARVTADAGSYVAVLRADANGRVTVLSPLAPADPARLRGDATSVAFRADGTPGVGYVFAIASRGPMDFRAYRARGGPGWALGALAREPANDPFGTVDRFARAVARDGYAVTYTRYVVGGGVPRQMAGPPPPAVRYGGEYGGAYGDPYGGYGAYGAYGTYGNAHGYGPPSGYGAQYGYGYGYGYDAYGGTGRWWGGYPGYHGYGYWRRERLRQFSRDPRTRYDRHCADGALVPYDVPCRGAFAPNPRGGYPGPVPYPLPQRAPAQRTPAQNPPVQQVQQPVLRQVP